MVVEKYDSCQIQKYLQTILHNDYLFYDDAIPQRSRKIPIMT